MQNSLCSRFVCTVHTTTTKKKKNTFPSFIFIINLSMGLSLNEMGMEQREFKV